MPKLVVMLRVKDGILFVRDWLENMEKLVDEIVVVDNGSTDGTLAILQRHPKVVALQKTEGFHEGKDKILAYNLARKRRPDWMLWMDIDEIFEERLTRDRLEGMMRSKIITRYFFRRYHFHNDYNHFESRWDKLIGTSWHDRVMWRESPDGFFLDNKIHNGLVQGIKGMRWLSNIRIKHYGAVDRDYLKKKTDKYIEVDPDRKLMYTRHRDQELPTWKWYEYTEARLVVTLQNTMMNCLLLISMLRSVFNSRE